MMSHAVSTIRLVKVCKHCSTERPADLFIRSHPWCRVCRYEYTKARRADPEYRRRMNAEQRARYAADDRLKAGQRRRYAQNPSVQNQRNRERYAKNPEAKLSKGRAWRLANIERSKEISRRWAEENADRYRFLHSRKAAIRRARLKGALVIPFTREQLAARLSMYPGCWMCGAPAGTVDHVKPLAKGGAHILANLRPACLSCNSGKRDRWPVAA